MGKAKLNNPFTTVGYYGSEYFCDREEETDQLVTNIQNGNSTTLIAVRRIGKTGLIHHVFAQLPLNWKGIYVDILATENLNEFLNLLATAIIRDVPEKSSLGKRFWEFIKSLRPVISFDPMSGEPQASFNVKRSDAELNIASVLKFIDLQDFKTVIAIDEFQQILNYPEKNTDAWLRTIIQQMKNVVFVFSGSRQHLMSDMFSLPNRPFFRSTQMLPLKKISADIYADFVMRKFKDHSKVIDIELVYEILHWSNLHTYYVQLIFNRLFSASGKHVTAEIWKEQAMKLLAEQEIVFIGYRNMLTNPQWQLLKAIAQDEQVYMPTAKDFINKHNLGSPATVLRSLKSLQNYELVYSDFDTNAQNYYTVYDILFSRWCSERGIG
ncbi:MAG: ATP-binding protein [Salinivirgaceae bacterium]|nr:ATP-binding protein [Salinivirgaceae bacterium]MDD4747337.1 ATP-binding protein [Salinivirgaceae bacterium]